MESNFWCVVSFVGTGQRKTTLFVQPFVFFRSFWGLLDGKLVGKMYLNPDSGWPKQVVKEDAFFFHFHFFFSFLSHDLVSGGSR